MCIKNNISIFYLKAIINYLTSKLKNNNIEGCSVCSYPLPTHFKTYLHTISFHCFQYFRKD